jgi:hypothetical protein
MKNIIWDDTFYFIHCDSNYNWCRSHELGGEKSHKKFMVGMRAYFIIKSFMFW